jgi:hypothetical protein
MSMNDAHAALLDDMAQPGAAVVLLVAQMGGTPDELQLVVETAIYDEEAHGLRPRGAYVVRCLGVVEHRLALGISTSLRFIDGSDHPLLYHTNTPRVAVHFDGRAADINALVLDLSQAYVSVFLNWRHLVDQVEDFNRTVPLFTLLERGFGLLGTMPKPLAERVSAVLAHHGVSASLSEDTRFTTHDAGGRSTLPRLLLIDDSYVLALDFSIDRMGRR